MKSHDTEFEDHILRKATPSRGGGYELSMEDGIGFFVDSCPIVPMPGMTARFYGRGFGWPVRGVDIDGHECFYRTPHQQEQKQRDDVDDAQRKRRREFELKRADYDRRYDALPEMFRIRIARFRANCPTFRWEYEPYELFCCEQAVEIATTLKTVEAVEAFKELSLPDASKAVPSLSDSHSGNTFGCAVGLARLFIQSPEAVVMAMGAMVPVVGSVAYGDLPIPAGEGIRDLGQQRFE